MRSGKYFALPSIKAALDLICEEVAAPPMFLRMTGIPKLLFSTLQSFNAFDVLAPRQSCSKLPHDLLVGKHLRKGTHIFEISRQKAGPIDHADTHPALLWRANFPLPMLQ